MPVRVIDETTLRSCVDLTPEALAVVERGFGELSAGRVVQPPIMRIDVKERDGELDVKSAYVPGEPSFAVKLSSGFFRNHELGLPSGSGLMILVSAETGRPEAILLDNGYLTDVRTALAGAIAAKHLAPEGPVRVGVVGAGNQARFQLRALGLVREIDRVMVYGRNADRVARYVEDTGAHPAASISELVRASDVVITTTPAKAPLIHPRDLHPRLHITAMGSDAEEKQELDAAVPGAADLFVCDRRSQSARLGELRAAIAAGFDESNAAELGDITAGRRPGRTSAEQVTVCDLTGTGVQDTMIATFALRRVAERAGETDD